MFASVTISCMHRVGQRNIDATGYEIVVQEDNGKVVGYYSAGANPVDSQACGSNEYSIVKQWAIETAKDMLRERGAKRPYRIEFQKEMVAASA